MWLRPLGPELVHLRRIFGVRVDLADLVVTEVGHEHRSIIQRATRERGGKADHDDAVLVTRDDVMKFHAKGITRSLEVAREEGQDRSDPYMLGSEGIVHPQVVPDHLWMETVLQRTHVPMVERSESSLQHLKVCLPVTHQQSLVPLP